VKNAVQYERNKRRGRRWRLKLSTSVNPDPFRSMQKTQKRMRPPFGQVKSSMSKETDCS